MSRRAGNRNGLRGQPVAVLIVLLLAWGAFRFATFSLPFHVQPQISELAELGGTVNDAPVTVPEAGDGAVEQGPADIPSATPSEWLAPALPAAPVEPSWSDPEVSTRALEASGREFAVAFSNPRMVVGHAMLMAAGFSQMEIPAELAAFMQRPGSASGSGQLVAMQDAAPHPVALLQRDKPSRSRWSADGWLLWRQDSISPLQTGRPTYGRSQLGAVVRYALAPSNAHRPQAHLRASAALEGARENEAAVGLSARPIAQVPLRVAVEARVSERAGGTEVRPAAFAVTELPPVALPVGLRAEAYAQGGYVGGDFATGFVDGQARIDRSFAGDEDFDLRAGAAVWGGAQKGAARLDVGPSAALSFRVGETRGRLAADYRFRVAGDAQPSSGPALTLSAGF